MSAMTAPDPTDAVCSAPESSNLKLSERQRAVLERIDRRVPIKVIAGEMGVSEARINQHIRALKDKFEVESMNELVACFRERVCQDTAAPSEKPAVAFMNDMAEALVESMAESAADDANEGLYRKSIYINSQLSDDPIFPDQRSRSGPGNMVFSDAHHVLIDAPWVRSPEPVVVPQYLDGDHAVLSRMLAMIAIAFGIVAAIVLVVSAAISVSEVLDGKVSIQTEA